jgi:8-oxo-dGTP pyrophosphatase MutT (NUDIX family)
MRKDKRRHSESVQHVQYAALPYRETGKSKLEVMLVTSRGTHRWIIPKGWPKIGLPSYQTAKEEAFEEAGVSGKVSKRRIGAYLYTKTLKKGDSARCNVHVFPLRVDRQHKKWPEKNQRRTRWFKPAQAAKVVQEPNLRRIIRKFRGHS